MKDETDDLRPQVIKLLEGAAAGDDPHKVIVELATSLGVPTGQGYRTMAMVKRTAVEIGDDAAILRIATAAGFEVAGFYKGLIARTLAERLYAEHAGRPYYEGLIDSVTNGEVILLELHAANAVRRWRDLMGASDPDKASPGTLRRMFGRGMPHNGTHGSDSDESADRELALVAGFFS